MAEAKTTTTNLKLRLNKILSSLTSCKSQNMIPQVISRQTPSQLDHIHSPLLLNRNSDQNPFVSPKLSKPSAGNYPSLCRPRCPESFDRMVRDSARLRHLDAYYHYSLPPSRSRRIKSAYKEREKTRPRRRKKKKTHLRKGKNEDGFSIFPLIGSSNDEDWFSSDDEREDDRKPLFSSFSSKSFSIFSSDDSDSNHTPPTLLSAPRSRSFRGKNMDNYEPMTSLEEKSGGEVKGSLAVVKSSCDPYNDFRKSMVEMIIERQMFGAKELERLLRCFLCLNDECHHRVIVEVFAEILETLFPHISVYHG